MKKLLYITGFCLLFICQSFAQTTVTNTIQVFPYQKTSEATGALATMKSWEASDWKAFFKLLEDTTYKTKATYALHAYVNNIANSEKRAAFAKQLSKQKRKAKSDYAKIAIQDELNLLTDASISTQRNNDLPKIKEIAKAPLSTKNHVQK